PFVFVSYETDYSTLFCVHFYSIAPDNMPDDVNEWLFFKRNDDNINLILRAWLDGYTVKKPQLFYLKNKITCGVLVYDDSPGLSEVSELYATGGEFELENYTFTQEDIDAMEDLGSYEKIEVVK
ncbi:DUF1642 domain-containing protein, partial [Lactococcus taiwanensis]|uniref:DUF1642 domain-containing protein n=1 Tax=Lactococcus taiwanensis TaxID=1151742 RepID=UPI003519BCA7